MTTMLHLKIEIIFFLTILGAYNINNVEKILWFMQPDNFWFSLSVIPDFLKALTIAKSF